MTKDEFSKAVEAMFAYDMGATDSGIHDEQLLASCVAYWRAIPESEKCQHEAVLVRELWLTDEKIAHGYGCEEVVEFLGWFQDNLDRAGSR